MKLNAQALLTVRANRDELVDELSQLEGGALSHLKPEEVNMLRHRIARLDAIIRKQREVR
jgi:hypothetical protein